MTVISGDAVVAMEWLDIIYIYFEWVFSCENANVLVKKPAVEVCFFSEVRDLFRPYFPGSFFREGSVSPSTQRETGRTQCLRQYITLLFTLIRAANGGFSRLMATMG